MNKPHYHTYPCGDWESHLWQILPVLVKLNVPMYSFPSCVVLHPGIESINTMLTFNLQTLNTCFTVLQSESTAWVFEAAHSIIALWWAIVCLKKQCNEIRPWDPGKCLSFCVVFLFCQSLISLSHVTQVDIIFDQVWLFLFNEHWTILIQYMF